MFKDVSRAFARCALSTLERKAGLDSATAYPSSSLWRGARFSGRATSRRSAYRVQRRRRESVLHHVDQPAALTAAHRLLGRHRRCLLDDRLLVRAERLVVAQQIFARGLLVQDHRVTPYCPRCRTRLSTMARTGLRGASSTVGARADAGHQSPAGRPLPGVSLLVWTTTRRRWCRHAVAVEPDATYQVVRVPGEFGDSDCSHRRGASPGGAARRPRGTGLDAGPGLEHTGYARPFDLIDIPDAHYVILAELRHHRGRSGLALTRRRRSAPRTRLLRRLRAAAGLPCCPTARSTRRCRWWAGCSSRPPTPTWWPTSRRVA